MLDMGVFLIALSQKFFDSGLQKVNFSGFLSI